MATAKTLSASVALFAFSRDQIHIENKSKQTWLSPGLAVDCDGTQSLVPSAARGQMGTRTRLSTDQGTEGALLQLHSSALCLQMASYRLIKRSGQIARRLQQ